MRTGYLTVGHLRGAPIRFHWSTPLIAVFIGLTSGAGLSLFTLIAAVLVLALLLAHELGHAFWVWRYGHRVHSVDLYGFHGACRFSGHCSRWEHAVIAWGGVMAQGVLLAIALLAVLILGPPKGLVGYTAAEILIRSNLFLIALNLIPFAPLDGATAWQIVPMIRDRARLRTIEKTLQRRKGAPKTQKPRLRLLTPPPPEIDDYDPDALSEESRRAADAAIKEALERSRRRDDEPKGPIH